MFHSRYYINYGRIFEKLVAKNNSIDNNVMTFLVTLMSGNDACLDLLVQSISLLEAKNMFIYRFQDKDVKVIFKDTLDPETKGLIDGKKGIDEFEKNWNDNVIYTDFLKHYCSCKEYQSKYNRYLLQDNYNNHIELKEQISLSLLLENDERVGIDMIGLLSYEVILEKETIAYDYVSEKKLAPHLRKFIKGEYKDIIFSYTTGDLMCSHMLSCNILLKNGYINIYRDEEHNIVYASDHCDDTLEIINENRVFNFYVETAKSVYNFEVENLNDWLYLQYNII